MEKEKLSKHLSEKVTPEVANTLTVMYYRIHDMMFDLNVVHDVRGTIFTELSKIIGKRISVLANHLNIDVCEKKDDIETSVFPWRSMKRVSLYVVFKTIYDLDELVERLELDVVTEDEDEQKDRLFHIITVITDDLCLLNKFIQDEDNNRLIDPHSQEAKDFVRETDYLIGMFDRNERDEDYDEVEAIADKLIK